MMLSKVFAVIAAMLLVSAVAAGTLAPQDMSLGAALTALDHLRFEAIQDYVRGHVSAWLWDYPVQAFMERPVWLLPAAIGLLFAGGSMTAASMQKAPSSSRRRRS